MLAYCIRATAIMGQPSTTGTGGALVPLLDWVEPWNITAPEVLRGVARSRRALFYKNIISSSQT
ncbi:MAG: hypothetical protein ACRETD_01975, partial [Steroidobacteraceae bacterium]